MASELIRPHVVGFLDQMLKEQGSTLRVEEIEVGSASRWAGTALHDLNLKGQYNLLVLGLKNISAGAELMINPPDNAVVPSAGVIIAMGDMKDIQRARQDARACAGSDHLWRRACRRLMRARMPAQQKNGGAKAPPP